MAGRGYLKTWGLELRNTCNRFCEMALASFATIPSAFVIILPKSSCLLLKPLSKYYLGIPCTLWIPGIHYSLCLHCFWSYSYHSCLSKPKMPHLLQNLQYLTLSSRLTRNPIWYHLNFHIWQFFHILFTITQVSFPNYFT